MLWTSDSCWARTVSLVYFRSKLRDHNILIWNSDSEYRFCSNSASPFDRIFPHIFEIMKLLGDAILVLWCENRSNLGSEEQHFCFVSKDWFPVVSQKMKTKHHRHAVYGSWRMNDALFISAFASSDLLEFEAVAVNLSHLLKTSENLEYISKVIASDSYTSFPWLQM